MNPKYARVAGRLQALIDEGVKVAALDRQSDYDSYIEDRVALNAWLVKVNNIVQSVFGERSAHFKHLQQLQDRFPERAHQINAIVGLLTGALDDLEAGFLAGQERLIAGAVFDSVLEQARTLVAAGFKDPAAVLGRVVLEDLLRRLCREANLADAGSANALNESLKAAGRYAVPQWRQVSAWLDIGNAAAHGKFADFDDEDVRRMLEDIERFWAQELG